MINSIEKLENKKRQPRSDIEPGGHAKQEFEFLSCKGLPDGRYQFVDTLQCMNWLFLQPRVDVAVNAWLASDTGCKSEWLYPLRALWQANTIPVFAAGNYAETKNMSYSPANLNPFGNELPLLSVGALTKHDRRLQSSSYGSSECGSLRPTAVIMTQAENLKVASPFQKNSYQIVEGTSYAVALVGIAIARLKWLFPNLDNHTLTNALLESSKDLGKPGVDEEYGYGKLDLQKTILTLAKSKPEQWDQD